MPGLELVHKIGAALAMKDSLFAGTGHDLLTQALTWVLKILGHDVQLISIEELAGATSSELHLLQIRKGENIYRVILRRFVNKGWLDTEPDLALHESASLRKMAGSGLPVPELIAYDEFGHLCGVPAVLMTWLPGGVILDPPDMGHWIQQMAEMLVKIHEQEASDFPWQYFTYNDVSQLMPPSWSRFQAEWEQAIEIVQGPTPPAKKCFIHRDYHPTNVLWNQGKVSGVVDWVNSCHGWPGLDLGHCRLNLAQLYGLKVADDFLREYRLQAGSSFDYHPYWDLLAAIDFLPGPPTVYRPWLDFGVRDLTDQVVGERFDAYLTSLVARL
jgi:hypothetical protein